MNEIAAHLRQMLGFVRTSTAEARLSGALHKLVSAAKAGFNPSQPRHPAGTPNGGQWVGENGPSIPKIIAAARRITGGPSSRYSACVDLCYPILERLQPPGSDFNLWDYHKCLTTCLNR